MIQDLKLIKFDKIEAIIHQRKLHWK